MSIFCESILDVPYGDCDGWCCWCVGEVRVIVGCRYRSISPTSQLSVASLDHKHIYIYSRTSSTRALSILITNESAVNAHVQCFCPRLLFALHSRLNPYPAWGCVFARLLWKRFLKIITLVVMELDRGLVIASAHIYDSTICTTMHNQLQYLNSPGCSAGRRATVFTRYFDLCALLLHSTCWYASEALSPGIVCVSEIHWVSLAVLDVLDRMPNPRVSVWFASSSWLDPTQQRFQLGSIRFFTCVFDFRAKVVVHWKTNAYTPSGKVYKLSRVWPNIKIDFVVSLSYFR